jgi:hypothetical protein
MIDTRICRELMTYLETREKKTFEDAFLATGVTEFFLYGGYTVFQKQSLDATYPFTDLNCETVWPHEADLEKSRHKIEATVTNGSAFFAVHRRAFGSMSAETIETVSSFLHRKGLDTQEDPALKALTLTARRGLREQRAMDFRNKVAWKVKSIREKLSRSGDRKPPA